MYYQVHVDNAEDKLAPTAAHHKEAKKEVEIIFVFCFLDGRDKRTTKVDYEN